MPIRITGMNSGLDTEAIIAEMVKAQKTKTEKTQKQQTSLEWKQEAWKELNSKIYKLFNTTLNNMRFQADYSKKTTDVADSSIASVITGSNTIHASQNLEVTQLATTAYLTGSKVDDSVKKDTKLTSLTDIAAGTKIKVTTGGETKEI